MSFGFATRLAGLYAAMFIVSGVQLPFFPLWLRAKGLDASEIGVVLAVPMVVRIVAIPFATRFADRRDALREAIVAMSLASVGGFLLLGLTSGFAAIFAAFVIAALAYTPIMPLAETYALKGLSARGRSYGPVRLWGSAAFIAGALVTELATDLIPASSLIWLMFGATVLVALSALTLPPLGIALLPPHERPQAKRLLRDPVFMMVIVSASLIQGSHALYYAFSALAWRTQGYDGTTIAALWALGVIAEIVLFAVQGRLPSFMTPALLLMCGAFGGGVRWVAMAFDPPALVLPLLQVLHALSFGASHLGALMYLARTVPAGQGATAQGYLAIALGIAMAAMTGISGLLFARYGVAAYAAMALAAIAGGICAFVAHRAGRVTAL